MTDAYVDAGRLEAQVVADLKGFAARLRTQLTAATKGINATVGVKVDTKGLREALRTQVAAAAKGVTAPVGLRLDTKGLREALRTQVAAAATGVNATVGVKLDTAQVRTQLAAATRGANLPVNLELSATQIKAQLRALGAASRFRLPVGLSFSVTKIRAQLAAMRTANLTLPVSLKISGTGIQRQLDALSAAGRFTVKATADVQGPGPTGGDPAGGGAGTGDPNTDQKTTQRRTQGAKDYQDALDDLTATFRRLEKANLAAEGAQRKLSAAQKKYRADSDQLRRANLAFAQAEDRRTQARKAAAEAFKDAKTIAPRGDIDLKRAEQQLAFLTRDRRVSIKADLDRVTLTNALRQASTALTKFGGAPSTISLFSGLGLAAVGAVGALGSLSAAIAPVVNNLFLLPAAAGAGAAAIGSLIVGFEGLGGAIKALTAKDLTKWREALAKLTPAAQDVALAMYQVQPTLTSIRKAVQESLLQGVGGDMRTFAATYLGASGLIGRALTGSAKSWNAAIRSTFDYLIDTTTTPIIAQGLRQVDAAGQQLSRTLRPLTNIFVQLFTGGMPFITRIAKGLADMTVRLSEFLQTSRQSGAMAAFFERGFTAAKQVGRILRDLTIGLGNFFRAGTGEGQGMLASIEKALARFREFTGSAAGQEKFKQFWRDTRLLMDGVVQTIGLLSQAVGTVGAFFNSWSESLKRSVVPATVLVGLIGKIAGGIGRIIGGALTMTAASTMMSAASLQNTAALAMLRAAGMQATGALAGAGSGAAGGIGGRLAGRAAAGGIGGRVAGAALTVGASFSAALPLLLGAAAVAAVTAVSIKVLGKIAKDSNKPPPKDDKGFQIVEAGSGGGIFGDINKLDKVTAARTKEIRDIEQKFGVHLGQIQSSTARDEFGKTYQLKTADPGVLKAQTEAARAQADSYELGIKNAQAALKTAGLDSTVRAQLLFDITDFTAKAAIVNNQRVALETEPTTALLVANVKSATNGIAVVEKMLADPTLTKERRIALGADLTKLKRVKSEANVLLDIRNKTVEIQGNATDLEKKIKTTKELLGTKNLDPEVRISLELQLAEFERQYPEVMAQLADLQTQKINPKFVSVQTDISDAVNNIATLRAELDSPATTKDRKAAIKIELGQAETALNALYVQFALLPQRLDANGKAAGDAWGAAMLATLPPAGRVAVLKTALEMEKAWEGYLLKSQIPAAATASKSASVGEGLARDLARAQGRTPSDVIAQQLAAARAAQRAAAAGTAAIRTGGPVRGQDGFKDPAADKADKAADADAKRRDAATKRAAAAREKAEREAAQRAEAVRNTIQAMANRGFITGLTSTINQIKSAAKQMVGFVKVALGKGALPLTTRINTDTNRLVALAQTRDTVIKRLEDAQARLKDLAESAARVRQDIADRVMGTFNLVDGNTATTAGAIIKRLTAAVDGARKFAAALQTLRGRGLAGSLLQQLAAAGPAEGQGTADALTKATDEELSAVNQLYKDMQGSAAVGGKVVADALYSAGVQAATGLVNGLLAQRKTVEASMVTIATALQNAIKGALKIKSPSLVAFDIGGNFMTGLDGGLMGPTTGITKNLTTWATNTMTSVRAAFTAGVASIGAAWAGIVAATNRPVRTVIDVGINKGILTAYNLVAKQFGVKLAALVPVPKELAAPVKLATGGAPGRVRGKGTRTSDSNLTLLSRDEHVLAAKEVDGLGGHASVEQLRAAARTGALRGVLPGFAAGGGLSGSGPATYPNMVAWLKKNFPASRASTYAPDFGYHRAPPGGYAADVFPPGVGSGAPPAMAVFNAIRNTFKKHIQELIYTWAGPRQVWNGQDHTFTGAQLQADHRGHIHWSMLADGFGGGLVDTLINPVRANIAKALAGLTSNPALQSPFGKMLTAGVSKLGNLVGPAAETMLNAGPALTGDSATVAVPQGTDLSAFPASVKRWAPTVLAVLARLGQPDSNLGAVLRRINFESSGNPAAINLTDSNFRAGHPSQGLMQTIPGTFAAHAGPYAARGITDPFANIYAGLHYAIGRYGSIGAIDPLVRPFGYDNGGWLRPDDIGVNHTRKPEAVFSHGEFDRLVGALEQVGSVRAPVLSGRSATRQLGTRPLASMTVPSQRASAAQIDTTAAAPVINVYPRATQSEAEIARGVSRELAWASTPWGGRS